MHPISSNGPFRNPNQIDKYSLIAPDVTVAMLVERTIEKKSFGNLTIIVITPKLELHFSTVLATTGRSRHVSEIKEHGEKSILTFPLKSL